VLRYVPEFEQRWNRFARPVNTSWRVDETYINIRGEWSYLYLAVDKHAKTVDQQAERLGSSASAA
jgi:transposase-like protein